LSASAELLVTDFGVVAVQRQCHFGQLDRSFLLIFV